MSSGASQTFSPIYGSNVVGLAPVVFSFNTNGSSDPDTTTIRGNKVASVTWSATGKWIVTLTHGFYQIVGVTAQRACTSAGADLCVPRVYIPDESVDPLVLHVFLSDDADALTNGAADARITVVLWTKVTNGN